jgi:hypothetical protein
MRKQIYPAGDKVRRKVEILRFVRFCHCIDWVNRKEGHKAHALSGIVSASTTSRRTRQVRDLLLGIAFYGVLELEGKTKRAHLLQYCLFLIIRNFSINFNCDFSFGRGCDYLSYPLTNQRATTALSDCTKNPGGCQ